MIGIVTTKVGHINSKRKVFLILGTHEKPYQQYRLWMDWVWPNQW